MTDAKPAAAGPAPQRSWQDEDMLRLLVDSVMEYAIFVLDPGGHVVTWNRGAQRLKGYRPEEIIGQHFSRFYPPEVSRSFIDEELVIAAREGQFRDQGWRLRSDGTRFWADVTITALRDVKGILRGYAKVTKDMTEARRAEEERAQLIREQAARREAEHANRIKDEFLATLSHELRTPLNAIVGWVNLLESGVLDVDAAKNAVQVIRRNAAAQTQLISDILDISRISAGKVSLDVKTVDLEKVVQAAIDGVTPAAEAKGIVIVRQLGTDAGQVNGDPDRLLQVAWNVLTNAVKFTKRGGRVEVRLFRVNSNVRLTVEDTGIGIAPGFIDHVFEPFRQADGSPTRQHAGLGLGLAIVKHLVTLHGGRVSVSSPGEGQGTQVTVDLPWLAVADEVSETNEAADAWSRAPNLLGLRVLVVEDDEDSRELVRATLEKLGASVDAVSSAAGGYESFLGQRPDVVVSDIEMPGESGYELVRRIRALPVKAGGLVPAVALTAYARPEDRIKSLAAGFQIHLAKPVHPAELAATIAALTGRRRTSPGERP